MGPFLVCQKGMQIMITIYDDSDLRRVLAEPIDIDLRKILLDRLQLLAEYLCEWDLADLANFIIVEPGDTIEAIEAELGISPLQDAQSQVRYPDPSFEPAWEFCIARKGYYDVTFALCDSGLGLVLLVPDQEGVVPELRAMLKVYATTNPKPTG